jgi:NAD(P)-dependent dehydrogenase (short-subunit alcohol dehydrogenase family)
VERIDLSGRVAVVTGAGRGIGRAHAVALASRGAAVVVNDIGVGIDGSGPDAGPAAEVAEEIRNAGGRAVASTDDVATPEGGEALVARAGEEFGPVDIVVHNAGVVLAGPFATQPLADVRRVLDVHLLGAWHVGQPAWRTMAARGFGRIVLTTSGAIFGHPMVAAYAAAKHGIIGLTRSLHQEAVMAGLDIKVNALAPIAATRMAREAQKERFGALMDPAAVGEAVVYLASPACALSGEVVHAGAGHWCRIFLGQTPGWAAGAPGVTAEALGDHLAEAFDDAGFAVPPDTNTSTDLIHERATGRSETMSRAQIAPDEVESRL